MRARCAAVMGSLGRAFRQMRELEPTWSLGILSSKELPSKPLLWLSISHITRSCTQLNLAITHHNLPG